MLPNRYSIRVGRSLSPQGPFKDKKGKDLVDGGGELVYGSNRDVYAPGGQGILADIESDILYYHYRECSGTGQDGHADHHTNCFASSELHHWLRLQHG